MAAYKTLKGQSIRQVAQDPTNPLLGEIWYNTTIGSLKGYQTISSAWASGGSSANGGSSRIGFGIQTAGIAAGGSTAPGNQTVVEEYNGSGWANGGNLTTG